MEETALNELVLKASIANAAIKKLETELKPLKAALVTEAKARTKEHQKTENGGSFWRYSVPEASAGVLISFPTDKIVSIETTESLWAKVTKFAGEKAAILYETVTTQKPSKDFRGLARRLFAPKEAEKLIKLASEEATPRVTLE